MKEVKQDLATSDRKSALEAIDLHELFKSTEVSPKDFVAWATKLGVNISNVEVYDHRNGKRRITKFAALAYLAYFNHLATVKFINKV